eukprot:3885291-Rhodomonas_salina.1
MSFCEAWVVEACDTVPVTQRMADDDDGGNGRSTSRSRSVVDGDGGGAFVHSRRARAEVAHIRLHPIPRGCQR